MHSEWIGMSAYVLTNDCCAYGSESDLFTQPRFIYNELGLSASELRHVRLSMSGRLRGRLRFVVSGRPR